ncbi:MAG: hypothetical protein H7098_05310 [Oligoflexus sp.]|nr:hypothetical protein [Pseudopedobacter sp.]
MALQKPVLWLFFSAKNRSDSEVRNTAFERPDSFKEIFDKNLDIGE